MKTIKVASLVTVLGLLALLAWSLPAAAQSGDGCPSGARCVSADSFDSGTDGWKISGDGLTLTWQASKSTTMGSSANGVAYISGSNVSGQEDIKKTFNLQPGNYQLHFRATNDLSLATTIIDIFADFPDMTLGVDASGTLSPWYFTEFTSNIIPVRTPGPVGIEIVTGPPTYYDYIWLEKIADVAPTPTPNPHWDTPTPRPGTPIPTEAQATPQATGTPYCVPAPATGLPAFSLTPTATPPAAPMSPFLDTFKNYQINTVWNRSGLDVYGSLAMDHTGIGGSGSAFIGYNGFPITQTTASAFGEALILQQTFSDPFYINLWAQADVVPVGATGYVEIWTLNSGTWTRTDQVAISAQHWYPLHVTISGSVSAIALIAARSDQPPESAGGIFIDDVYIYGTLSEAPYCDGSYPSLVVDVSGENLEGIASTYLNWPADRACPVPAPVPNNFWGPLLNGVALFIDSVFSFAPLHQSEWLSITAQNTLLSPIGVIFSFAAILLDWTVPITVLKIWLGIQGIFWAIMAWRIIRYSTVE